MKREIDDNFSFPTEDTKPLCPLWGIFYFPPIYFSIPFVKNVWNSPLSLV